MELGLALMKLGRGDAEQREFINGETRRNWQQRHPANRLPNANLKDETSSF
jgi:hypothetical protein